MQEYKLLVVDDEADFVRSLAERLQTRKMKAEVALSGEEALAKTSVDEPEVMVLDLKMPGLDGLEVLQRIKMAYPTTQVIILTGHSSLETKEQAEGLGAFAYLEKPVEISTLVRIVKQAHDQFLQIKKQVDAALMGMAMSSIACQPDMARNVMAEVKDE
ncbi:response regulator [Desulfovibrio inopinatus]|uniref:response regulator n=1 Tax=Desulfovibrio inopinatus TaxID=102109 RepID=UPI00040192B7|nr:response regulator [Desulfovibrio inopinatus]